MPNDDLKNLPQMSHDDSKAIEDSVRVLRFLEEDLGLDPSKGLHVLTMCLLSFSAHGMVFDDWVEIARKYYSNYIRTRS